MGLFNLVRGGMTCPRCGSDILAEVETKLGDMSNLTELCLGDLYPWHSGKTPENGGRPAEGTAVGDGYSVCPVCQRDFFVRVVVESDRVMRLESDPTRPGHLADS